jgi:hypothetical protein
MADYFLLTAVNLILDPQGPALICKTCQDALALSKSQVTSHLWESTGYVKSLGGPNPLDSFYPSSQSERYSSPSCPLTVDAGFRVERLPIKSFQPPVPDPIGLRIDHLMFEKAQKITKISLRLSPCKSEVADADMQMAHPVACDIESTPRRAELLTCSHTVSPSPRALIVLGRVATGC